MTFKIGMISLGCPKNQVDAEVMLKKLSDAGFAITPDEREADAIIVNTCGFIEEAKNEAIENIIEAAKFKADGKLRALIVTGCLAERYRDEISREIPEVDVVVGIGKNGDIVSIVKEALQEHFQNTYAEKEALALKAEERTLTTPPYTAYLKIAEGCDNCCTFCAIPLIRGHFRSKAYDDCIKEAEMLADSGVTELVLVAQDTTRYGEDLCGKSLLPQLLKDLAKIPGLHWIRTLYTYPERITDELLAVLRDEEKVVPYLDIPIQHCNGEILSRMNRSGDEKTLCALMEKIRRTVPNVTLRTTLLCGFPGETDEQFSELAEFVKKVRFDRLGCFAYSEEEDTPAADFKDQVDRQTREDRAENIMNEQLLIVDEKNRQKIGKTFEVLIEGYDNYIRCYFGRSAADAPEIDGKIFFVSDKPLEIGSYVRVRINDTIDYDLLGELEGMDS